MNTTFLWREGPALGVRHVFGSGVELATGRSLPCRAACPHRTRWRVLSVLIVHSLNAEVMQEATARGASCKAFLTTIFRHSRLIDRMRTKPASPPLLCDVAS